MKHRLKKARNLINRWHDSWGSNRNKFKLRLTQKAIARKADLE